MPKKAKGTPLGLGQRKSPKRVEMVSRRIPVKPAAESPQKLLNDIITRIKKASDTNTYCNLSPAECWLLDGSIEATCKELSLARVIVSDTTMIAFGKKMTVAEVAERLGYDL